MPDPALDRIRQVARARLLARRTDVERDGAPEDRVTIDVGQAHIVPTTEEDRRGDYQADRERMRRSEQFRRESSQAREDTRRDAADTAAFQHGNEEHYRRAMRR